MIFDEATLRKLESLALIADQVRVGRLKGDRRSKKRGSSIEFADYRNYVKGDDLRRLDWNVYARLERPFIKLLEEEEDLAVHILVDASLSMDWPGGGEYPHWHKLRYAVRLAAALGYIALTTGDQLTVSLMRSDGSRAWGPYRGLSSSLRLFQFLETAAEGSGITDLNLSLRNYALRGRRPGLLLILTDLLSPGGYQDGLSVVQGRGYEVNLLHLLSPDEIEPAVSGDIKLVDAETGAEAEITLDPDTIAAYRRRLEAWRREIGAFCAGRSISYIPITTDMAWDRLVLQTLRVKEILK